MNQKIKNFFSFRTVLVLGILACLVCIIPFSRNLIISLMENFVLHRQLRDIQKWTDILVHSMFYFITIMSFWLFFWYSKKGKEIGHSIFETARNAFTDRNALKYLVALAVIFFIAYWALIRANYEHADDIRRCYSGHKAWVGWSRYVSEILAVFLHTNFFINDISPVIQLWTIAIMAVFSYSLAYIIMDGKITKLSLLASSFACLSPFFFSNVAYKFDCPYMALAMLFGVLPFLFLNNNLNFIFMSFISLILVCTSYQAANSIYIILAIFSAFKMWLQKKSWKEIGIFTVTSIVCYCAALIYFRIVLMNTFEGTQVSRGTGIATGMSALTMIKKNFCEYVVAVNAGYGNLWIRIFTAFAVVLFPVSALFHQSERKGVQKILMSVAVLAGMFALSFGAYLVLEQALIGSRTFMGFDLLISLIAIYDIYNLKNNSTTKKIAGTVIVCLFYGLVIGTTVYGNFIQKQKDYENFRFTILLQDLSKIVNPEVHNSIYIGGITGMAGKTRMEQKNYPVGGGTVSPVLTQYLVRDWNMDFEYLSEDSLEELDLQPEFKKQITDLPLLLDSYYHAIYGKNNQYFVYLKNPQIKE